jgi:hypothetical protein
MGGQRTASRTDSQDRQVRQFAQRQCPKLLVALGASSLVGVAVLALVFGSIFLAEFSRRIGVGFNHSRTDPMCSDDANVSGATFYSEMSRVNARMHAGMEIAPSGNTDRDFARMMIAHHQGAIDMALVQLKYGRNEQLKRLGQSIIVEQGQEIAYMRTLLGNNQTFPANHVAGQ